MVRSLSSVLIGAFALSSLPAASMLSQDRAQDVLARARAALDTSGALAGMTGLSVGATVRRVMQTARGMEITSEVQLEFLLPDKYRRTESIALGPSSRVVTMAVSGDELMYDDGGMAAMMGRNPTAPGPLRDQTIANLRQDAFRLLTVWLLAPPASLPATFTYAGIAEAPDGRADVLDVQAAGGLKLRLFIDPTTHRLLMAHYPSEVVDLTQANALREKVMLQARKDPQNAQKIIRAADDEIAKLPKKAVTVEMRFSEYRGIGGVTLPSRMIVDTQGVGQEEWTIVSCKVNPPLTPERFARK